MIRRIRVVVFDLDDTLYPERDYVFSGFDAVGRWIQDSRGVTGFAAAAKNIFERGRRGDIFDQALRELNVPDDTVRVSELVSVYRGHTPNIELSRETVTMLKDLRTGGLLLAILTDGYRRVQERKVAALGLSDLVDFVCYSDTFGRSNWKPSPTPYVAVMERFDVNNNEFAYVGDNPSKDFVAARQLGWKTVRFRQENTEHSHSIPQPGFAADVDISSWEALDTALFG